MKATMQSVHANRAGSVWETRRGEDWRDRAACNQYDAEWWYGGERSPRTLDAKRICFTECPVREQCLKQAMDNREPWGVWGGLDEGERGFSRCGTASGYRQHYATDTPACERCKSYKRAKDRATRNPDGEDVIARRREAMLEATDPRRAS